MAIAPSQAPNVGKSGVELARSSQSPLSTVACAPFLIVVVVVVDRVFAVRVRLGDIEAPDRLVVRVGEHQLSPVITKGARR